MANDFTLGVVLQGTDKLSPIFKANGQAAKQMGSEVESSLNRSTGAFGRISAAGAAWGAAAGAMVDITRAATAAYAESEAAQLRLENAIANTGASFDEYKTQIEAASDAAVQLGFDDEDLSDALTALTQATGDTGAALNDLAMVQDLARARNMSLADAAKVVADAEAGRMRGLSALGLGITATMSKEEAFAIVMAKTGGAAEEYGDSTAGAIDRVQVQLGNLLEKAGGLAAPIAPLVQMLPAVQGGYTAVSTVVGALTSSLAGQTAASAAAGTALVAEGLAAEGAAVGMETASVASKGLMASLGPIGLALMAATAVAGLAYLVTRSEEVDQALIDAEESTRALNQTLDDLSHNMALTADERRLAETLAETSDLAINVNSNLRGQVEELGRLENAYQYTNDTVVELVDGHEQLRAGLSENDYWTLKNLASQESWNAAIADGKITGDEWADLIEETTTRLEEMGASSDDAAAAQGTLDGILAHVTDSGVDTAGTLQKIADAQARVLETGDFQQYLADLQKIREEMTSSPVDAWIAAWEKAIDPTDDVAASMDRFIKSVNDADPVIQQLDSDLEKLATSTAYAGEVQAAYTEYLRTGDIDAYIARIAELRAQQDAETAALASADQAHLNLTRAQIDAMNSTNELNAAGEAETAQLQRQADGVNALAEAQRLQAQAALDGHDAERQAALDRIGWTEKNIKAIVGGTNAQKQAATVQEQASRMQAEAMLDLAEASGETTDELAGQKAATDALAQGQQLQAQATLDAAGATETAAEKAERLQQAWEDATTAAGELILQLDTLVGKLVAAGDPTVAQALAYGLSLATAQAEDLRRVIVQIPDGLASSAQSTLDWANELVNVRGEWGRIDELLREAEERGAPDLFNADDWEAAQQAQESLQQSTADIQFYTDVIQAKLIPYLAEAQEAQAAWLAGLADEDEATQLAALGYMDQAESAKALAAAQQIAAAAQSGNTEATQRMIEQMAMADPVLKAMLLDMGLISEGADGEININWENAESTAATLDDVVTSVQTLAFVLAKAFNLDIDINADGIPDLQQSLDDVVGTAGDAEKAVNRVPVNPNIGFTTGTETETTITTIEDIAESLSTIDLTTATPEVDDSQLTLAWEEAGKLGDSLNLLDGYRVTVYVDYVETGTPPGLTPGNALGGVIGPKPQAYALGGSVALVGETGPEMVRLPYGSMVTPATATAQYLKGGGGGAVNLYGPVTVVANDPQAFATKLRARRLTEARA